MIKNLLLLSLLSSFTGCALFSGYKSEKIIDTKISTGLELKQVGKIYLAGQPSPTEFIKLREQDFVAVINLRKNKETGGYSESLERNNSLMSGLSYLSAGFHPSEDEITDRFLDKTHEVIKSETKKGKVLVHCSSGNRAAMWYGAYVFKFKGASKSQALNKAKELGAKENTLSSLRKYLSKK